MKIRNLILILGLVWFITGCSNSTDVVLPVSTKTAVVSHPTSVEIPTATTTIQPSATAVPTKTASPTAAHNSTAAATPTSTPQPRLVAHTWQLENILLQVEEHGGDGVYWMQGPPRLVLYSNGLLIRSSYRNGQQIMMGRELSRNEMCALFNTLDQVGFLDYDPSVYMDPMDGLGNTWITVNIWKKQQVYGQVLDRWIYEGGDWWREACPDKHCLPPPTVLPALANTYKLLDQYNPGGLVELPAKIMVLRAIPEELDSQPKPWPIEEISLKEITQETEEGNSFAIYVEDPDIIRALKEKAVSGYYVEGDVKRIVHVRPLWPGETHFGVHFPGLPTASPLVTDGTVITCSPEDGVLPVPEKAGH